MNNKEIIIIECNLDSDSESESSDWAADLDEEIKRSPEEINRLFQICNKKQLEKGDQYKLLDAYNVKNKFGDNILQSYIKSLNENFIFLDKLIKEDHDSKNINNEGDSAIYSCLLYCHNNIKIKYKKVNWLLDNGCPIDIPKYDITKFFLFEYPRKHQIGVFSYEYFTLLKRLFNMGLFNINLANNYKYISFGYLAFHCYDLNQIEWFTKNFKLNYEFHISPEPIYNSYFGNPFYYASINGLNNLDVLIYLLKISPYYLIEAVNKYNVLDNVLRYCNSTILSLVELYCKNQIFKDLEKDTWKHFTERLSTTFYKGINRYYKKDNLIFGLKFGKIKEFSINVIKGLRLTLDDFKGDIVNTDSGVDWEGDIHPDLLFPEDYDEQKAEEIKKVNNKSKDLKPFTKDFCLKEYQKIMDYINNNKFEIEIKEQPFNIRAQIDIPI